MSEKYAQVPVSLPTRNQIVEAILPVMAADWDRTQAPSTSRIADAVLNLIASLALTSQQVETLRNLACDGSGVCQSPLHVHGCYSDQDGTACDEPTGHSNMLSEVAA